MLKMVCAFVGVSWVCVAMRVYTINLVIVIFFWAIKYFSVSTPASGNLQYGPKKQWRWGMGRIDMGAWDSC
jgi:hypothetical protein